MQARMQVRVNVHRRNRSRWERASILRHLLEAAVLDARGGLELLREERAY